MKAIEVGFEALSYLGYPIPIDRGKAMKWAKDLRSRVPTDPAIIAVRYHAKGMLTAELAILACYIRSAHNMCS